ncbi:MAG: zinc ribbon domain-containing protein [Firmicutes bacterium]|nr:zinc ribbon domain-containing protein [Bacillota bacterium]
MLCKACGRALADNQRFCDSCGTAVNDGGSGGATPLAQQLRSEVKARSLDAWQGVKLFAKSPVGGLPESFALFDDRRAIQVGIVFAIAYEVAVLLGALIFKSRTEALLGGIIPVGQLVGDLTVKQLFKVLFLGLVPFVSLIAACSLARVIFRGAGRIAGDVYTAGAVVLPTGLLVLLASLLGAANVEVIAILFLFALTYSILILYAGCSRIGGISEAGAAPAVPIILVLSAWITKILVTALW